MAQTEYENAPVVPDPAIDQVLAAAVEQVRALKAQSLGTILDTPIRRLTPVSPLGNLVTDALLASVPGADLALNNSSGGLRADLPAGQLTYGRVYEVMPFDNVVVTVRLTGRQLRDLFGAHLQKSRRIIGFSGIRVEARCWGNSLDIALIRPSGIPIEDGDTLLVVVSDFLATGGDGILSPVLPAEGFPVDPAAPLVRDVLVDYLKELRQPLHEEQLLEAERPRLSVPGALPVTCSAG